MSGALRAEDAFQLELEGPSTHDSGDGLMETVALLQAIGSQIQAPAGLRARRGALLARGHRSGASVRSVGAWRRAPALVLAAALTLLMVVGVGAATLGSRWLGEPDSDERPDVRTVLPDLEPLDERETNSPMPSPSPATHERDEIDITEAGESDASEVEESDVTDAEEGDASEVEESDVTDAGESDASEVEESDVTDAGESDASEIDAVDSIEPEASDSQDSPDVIAPDDAAAPDEIDSSETGDDAIEPDGESED